MFNSAKKEDKKRILVVEDDLFLSDILCQKLLKHGFFIERAIDADETFKILEEKHIDLILLDLLLPDIEGQEVLKRLKETEKWKSIPVIIASNLDDPAERKRTKELGAVDYLVKAEHTPDEIIKRVAEELTK